VKDFQLKINSLGSVEDKENFSKVLRKLFEPKLSGLCPDCQKRFQLNVFRILDCKNKDCSDIVRESDISDSYLSKDNQDHFAQVKEALDSLRIKYDVCHDLVRGLDYYTHTVFEITGSSLGSQNAVSAGGRYNHLVSQLGGPEVPAIGFALGMERTILAIDKSKEPVVPSPDVYVIALDEMSFRKAFQVLSLLRSMDISSDMSFRVSSMKSQMRLADKSGARSVIILGESELEKECVSLKDMETGHQEEVTIKNNDYAALIDKLRERQQ
jgi:histidyl-tRNA synthetase